MILHLLLFSYLLFQVFPLTPDHLNDFLQRAQATIYSQKFNDHLWNYPTYLGTNFVSLYALLLPVLGYQNQSAFNISIFSPILESLQMPDGSWQLVPDLKDPTGNLDATILNYWALKAYGMDPNSTTLSKARDYILAHGGLEKADFLVKGQLALLRQASYESISNIPLFFFTNESIFRAVWIEKFVAQWCYSSFISSAYLAHYKISFEVGESFQIPELWIHKPKDFEPPKPHPKHPEHDIKILIQQVLGYRQKLGSFGGYTGSTQQAILILQDYEKHYPGSIPNYDQVIQEGFNFIEEYYFNNGNASYLGSLNDGRWWDDMLVMLGLIESGYSAENLIDEMDYFVNNAVLPNGGVPYGLDFEWSPDADDTAMAIKLMKKFGDRYEGIIPKCEKFIFDIQNRDGGFPAFNKGRTGPAILNQLFIELSGTAELFDVSSVDLTGHVLQAWGALGYTVQDKFVQEAIKFIKERQSFFGGWQGRWGINYIYAAGAAIPGLAAVGVDLTECWIRRAIDFIVSRQNSDGGFGESTLSYVDFNYFGIGVSTPTQTSWALLALLEVKGLPGYEVGEVIEKAVNYLVTNFSDEEAWVDSSVVGTGHREVIYIVYPSLSRAFPMMALGKYYDAVSRSISKL